MQTNLVELITLSIPYIVITALLTAQGLYIEAGASLALLISAYYHYKQASVIIPGTLADDYRPKADSGMAAGLLLVPMVVSALSFAMEQNSRIS
ncbi:hypothetical protein HDU97_009661 [Phlyctochytrium planicorne]|nr:hypothetical protein HDU97_009661 [Phlyctochytrium planicorne]